MKHASHEALDQLGELLARLGAIGALKEKVRGVFYVKSKAFLHFHEDPAGPFADVRTGSVWERCPVNTLAEQRSLLAKINEAINNRRN
jgi:hypothetical protein